MIENQGYALRNYLEDYFISLDDGDPNVYVARFIHEGGETNRELCSEKDCLLIVMNPEAPIEGACVRFINCSKKEIEEVIRQIVKVSGVAINFLHMFEGPIWKTVANADLWYGDH